ARRPHPRPPAAGPPGTRATGRARDPPPGTRPTRRVRPTRAAHDPPARRAHPSGKISTYAAFAPTNLRLFTDLGHDHDRFVPVCVTKFRDKSPREAREEPNRPREAPPKGPRGAHEAPRPPEEPTRSRRGTRAGGKARVYRRSG